MNNSVEMKTHPSLSYLPKLEDMLKMRKEEWESIYFEVKKDEICQEKEELKFTFGEKAKIEKEHIDEWLVESILESRGIVPGGQKVKIRLNNKTHIIIDSYTFKDIEINGGKIELPSEIVFTPKKANLDTSDYLDKKTKERGIDIFDDFIKNEMNGGQTTSAAGYQITLGGFTSAEDLVVLLHECGHQVGNNRNIGYKDYKFILESIFKLLPEEKLSEENINKLLLILKEENRASSNAITMIKDLRKKRIDLFPKDPNLVHINLFLSLSLSTYLKDVIGNINLGQHINNPKKFLDFDSSDYKIY